MSKIKASVVLVCDEGLISCLQMTVFSLCLPMAFLCAWFVLGGGERVSDVSSHKDTNSFRSGAHLYDFFSF